MAMIARMGRILNCERSLWGAEVDGREEDLGALLDDRRWGIEDRTRLGDGNAGLEKTPDAKRRAAGRDMRLIVKLLLCRV
jgi:hypothetical protein